MSPFISEKFNIYNNHNMCVIFRLILKSETNSIQMLLLGPELAVEIRLDSEIKIIPVYVQSLTHMCNG